MTFNLDYRLNRHHKFKQGRHKYVADLETHDIIEVSDVEWDVLGQYGNQTHYQIVEALKGKHKVNSIFDAIARLERLGKQGQLLTQIPTSARKPIHRKPKILIPFEFTKEKPVLDYITHLNRYQLFTAIAEAATLETLDFSRVPTDNKRPTHIENFGKLRIRQVEIQADNAFTPAWYASNGYDGILLLSQFLADNLLYYQIPDVPIVHCIESTQTLQSALLETLLHLQASQKTNDTLVVKASWMKDWLSEIGISEGSIRVIPDGITVTESIDKAFAKRQTAAIFDKPMFTQQHVIGLISGFEPDHGAQWISEFAQANEHLTIFVYDSVLAHHYKNPPDNVLIFRADDEEMATVLPLFFQALDLVCFPAIPGTPVSVVFEAMAYGAPCIAMTKYGLPPEVSGAGVSIECQSDNFGNFHVPMRELSEIINAWLLPSKKRADAESLAKNLSQKYTWQKTASEIIRLFGKNPSPDTASYQTRANLFPSIFCRRYNPQTRQTTSKAYRLGINRYEHLEKALAETLLKQHKTTEVESVFKHFKATVPFLTRQSVRDKFRR